MEDEPRANLGTRNQRTDAQHMAVIRNSQTSLPEYDSMVGTSYKKQLKNLARREEAERLNDHRTMEDHLYDCIYDIRRTNAPQEKHGSTLHRYKTKIICLHSIGMQNTMLDTRVQDKIDED
jgi:hypothetical protein